MKPRIFVSAVTSEFKTARTSRRLLILTAIVLLLGIGGYLAWQSTRTQLSEIAQPKPLDKSRLREHLAAASEQALARDLAEADVIKGDWEKRHNRTEFAKVVHRHRLSRVTELAEEFATLETSGNTSTTLSEMLRILDEQGVDQALAYLTSQSTRLLEKDTAKTTAARADLQPLLTGAQLAIANGQPEKAEALFQQLLTPGLPDWPQARHEYIVYLLDTKGSRQQTHESLAAALATYREAERQSRLLTLQEPENTQWQRDLSVSHERLGDIAVAQGDVAAAATAYTAALEIRKTLAARDPQNTEWQFDLGISHERLGEIAKAQGDLPAAAKAYNARHVIIQTLAAREPQNTEWQRDLSISHDKLGDIAVAQGDLPAAAKAYNARHVIIQALAARDPQNTEWQRDLAVCHERLGDIALKQDDLTSAKAAYTAALEIARALAARDPQNTEWQRDLSVCHYRLAIVAELAGDAADARAHYRKSHDVLQAIADEGKHVSPEDRKVLAMLKVKAEIE